MFAQQKIYLFKFAWKNLQRNKGRSFFISFSVSLAVLIAVWVIAFFQGLNNQIEQAVIDTNTGHFQIQESSYFKTTDNSSPKILNPDLTALITPEVQSFSPELIIDANISTPEGAQPLQAIGIIPDFHKEFLPIHSSITEGSFLTETDEGSIVIGQELAKKFKLLVGDQLILNYQDQAGDLRSEILSIKGIFHFSSRIFEKSFVYINQRTWKNLFLKNPMEGVLFNRITVRTNSLTAENRLKNKLEGQDLYLVSWKNLNPEMAVVIEFNDGINRFFFIIIAITIVMAILIPVQMLWQERLSEMKMLNIIGLSSRHFWQIGFFETIQMILTSSLMSILFLVVVIGIQGRTGIYFNFLNSGVPLERAGIQLPKVIYPLLSWDIVILTFMFVIFVLSTSYLISIYRTLKKLEVSS
jgi:ABC-type lipoprotein release transport system permease subunit